MTRAHTPAALAQDAFHSAPAGDEDMQASVALMRTLTERFPRSILLGGWAVWLHTRARPSRDVDVILEPWMLFRLRNELGPQQVSQSVHLPGVKWAINLEPGNGITRTAVHADVYVPHQSRLGLALEIPVEHLLPHATVVGGVRVLDREGIVAAKLAALIDRAGTDRGDKDRVDLSSLVAAGTDWSRLGDLLARPARGEPKGRAQARLRLAAEALDQLASGQPRRLAADSRRGATTLRAHGPGEASLGRG